MRNLLRELSFQDLVLKHYKVYPDYNPNKFCRPYQYFHYSAFGEVLVQRDANYGSFQTSYTFNAKEFDQETGLGYYGARYYNPTFSVWLGVDPLAHRYRSMSPYVYTGNNPIMLVDPDGMWVKGGDNWFGRFFQKVGNVFTGNGWNTNKELEEAEWVRKYEAEGNTILDEIVINIAKKENKQPYSKEGYGDSNEQHIKWPDAENKGDPIERFPMGGLGKAVGSWGQKLSKGLGILRKWISWGAKESPPKSDDIVVADMAPVPKGPSKVIFEVYYPKLTGDKKDWVFEHDYQDSARWHDFLKSDTIFRKIKNVEVK